MRSSAAGSCPCMSVGAGAASAASALLGSRRRASGGPLSLLRPLLPASPPLSSLYSFTPAFWAKTLPSAPQMTLFPVPKLDVGLVCSTLPMAPQRLQGQARPPQHSTLGSPSSWDEGCQHLVSLSRRRHTLVATARASSDLDSWVPALRRLTSSLELSSSRWPWAGTFTSPR